jgi:hypothetical protein
VTLDMLRAAEPALRAIKAGIESRAAGAVYLPFAFSAKRPVQTARGYLVRFQVAFARLFPELHVAEKPAAQSRYARGTRGSGRQKDPVVRRAVERHAVAWALECFDSIGYAVEDAGATE